MALRLARGLFRLWLVAAVLWVGGVAITTWRTLPTSDDFIPDPPEITKTAPPFDPNLPSTPFDQYLEDKKREDIKSAVLFGLLPPAFILALGSALVWAFRGFR
jgi:hypothetical protein